MYHASTIQHSLSAVAVKLVTSVVTSITFNTCIIFNVQFFLIEGIWIGLFVNFLFRMRMLVEKCTLCSIINIHGILGGWPPLECSDPRPSNSDRQYGGPCLSGIKYLQLLCLCEQVCYFFTNFQISCKWQKPDKKKSLSLTKSNHHPHFKVLPMWTISVFLMTLFISSHWKVMCLNKGSLINVVPNILRLLFFFYFSE